MYKKLILKILINLIKNLLLNNITITYYKYNEYYVYINIYKM